MPKRKDKQIDKLISRGFSLLELLVSLFLVSLFFLSFNQLLMRQQQSKLALRYALLANQQINYFANKLAVLPLEIADITTWNHENAQLLPQGHGNIIGDQLVIVWGGLKLTACVKTKIGLDGCLIRKINY